MVTSDGILYENNSRNAERCPVSTAPFDCDLEVAVLDWRARTLSFSRAVGSLAAGLTQKRRSKST
jgi:hypothetical protein